MIEKIRRLCHDYLGWGYPQNDVGGFDGASYTSQCRFCQGKLLMDSNMDWFHK